MPQIHLLSISSLNDVYTRTRAPTVNSFLPINSCFSLHSLLFRSGKSDRQFQLLRDEEQVDKWQESMQIQTSPSTENHAIAGFLSGEYRTRACHSQDICELLGCRTEHSPSCNHLLAAKLRNYSTTENGPLRSRCSFNINLPRATL